MTGESLHTDWVETESEDGGHRALTPGSTVVGSARSAASAPPAVPSAERPTTELPDVDWRDQDAAEVAWDAYLRGNAILRDHFGIRSPRHLMRHQREIALRILRIEGHVIPPMPPSADGPRSELGDWGGAWMPADLHAALDAVPADSARRAWREGAQEALDTAEEMYHLWTTDVF
ncbi:hypothetical protein [Streptomyces sp. NPDC048606]|uniref:hypothetical protein n=1 Tax=Streptomyces sp. NPDC048606 TaxID=3154726 RepID=UPI00343AEC12